MQKINSKYRRLNFKKTFTKIWLNTTQKADKPIVNKRKVESQI